ncbi:MAG TPA: AI-2E family transporter, partial [Reyranellaceae bacterium]|nr:AI-2E family transporter [Reyranellaceae bacterium]
MKPDTADALRAPLVVLAIAVVGFVGYFARDFLIPTAGAIVLALILTPVANALERLRLPVALAAALAVIFSTIAVGGLLALAVPSVQGWAQQAPMLTLKLQGKLEGLRQHIGRIEEVSKEVEKATTPAPPKGATPVEPPPEKVVVRERSLLGELASATPVVVLQVAYAIGLAFFLLSHRHVNRRQVLRIAPTFDARLKLARVMRAVYDRVGHYLFALTLIYFGVAVISAAALAVIGVPNAAIWGALLGLASFIPFAGAPLVVILVAVVAVFTFDDWQRIVAAPAALIVIHVIESQFVTPAVVGKRCAINTVAVFVGIAL